MNPAGDDDTVRAINVDRLDRRLAADGPDDELEQLADTPDDLLHRVETAFDTQQLFVANASHEPRPPLALRRADAEKLQIALGDLLTRMSNQETLQARTTLA